MKILRPFFRYYGAAWRKVHAGLYPHPLHDTIVEPFAGAAGYAMHHADRRVILVEQYNVIAEIWRWLIGAPSAEIMAIPLVDDVADLPPSTPVGARHLVGFSMNAAVTSPRRRISRAALALRAAGRKLYGWSAELRERVASQVEYIRHWRVIEGDYSAAPDVEATWFIDAPYQHRGGALCARLEPHRLRRASCVVPWSPRPTDRVRVANGDVAAVSSDRRGEVGAAHRTVGGGDVAVREASCVTDFPSLLPGETLVDDLIVATSALGRAVFTPDRRHRLALERYVEPAEAPVFITIVMVNPSTACAFKNDQTISNLIRRLHGWRARGITQATAFRVVNLFSKRSPYPDDLYEAAACERGADARNNAHILDACTRPGTVIAAWGAHGALGDRGRDVAAMLLRHGVTLHALKLTKGGAPSHPHARGKARIPDDTEPFVWRTP